MKALYFPGGRALSLEDVDEPSPGPDDVIVEIKASGLCGTDLTQWAAPSNGDHSSYMPARVVPGHEPCGVVVAHGSALDPRRAMLGGRVMVHHYSGCGTCQRCRSGWTQLCGHGGLVYGHSADGAHAKLLRVPASTLIRLPDELSFEEGAAIGCGTGTAYGGLKRIDVRAEDTLAVFGQGAVGLSATMLGKALGARVISVDVSPERLAAASNIGAHLTVNSAETDPVEAIRDATSGRGADAVLECTGVAAVVRLAIQSAGMWGRVGLVGMSGEASFDVSRDMIMRQLTVCGSWSMSSIQQEECARFIAQRGLPLAKIITHRFELAEAEEAYRILDQRTISKAVFVM